MIRNIIFWEANEKFSKYDGGNVENFWRCLADPRVNRIWFMIMAGITFLFLLIIFVMVLRLDYSSNAEKIFHTVFVVVETSMFFTILFFANKTVLANLILALFCVINSCVIDHKAKQLKRRFDNKLKEE